MNKTYNPIIIQKEEVARLHFPDEEVLNSTDEHTKREYEISRISSLGNSDDHVKVKIIFQDAEALRQVETTVWAVTAERVVLKGGLSIPINRIHEINL